MTTYNLHYNSCRSKYGKNGPSIYNLTIKKNYINDTIKIAYLVPTIAQRVKEKIDTMEGCFEDDNAYRLNEWQDIPEIAEYAEEVMPIIEKEIFSSHLKVEFVHPYRNKKKGKGDTSWLWHYDDCPKEFIKLFLYLTEVDEKSGCMEYVEEIIPTYRLSPAWTSKGQVYPRSRIPRMLWQGKK